MKSHNRISLLIPIFIGITHLNSLATQWNNALQYISPPPNALGISPNTNITVTFDSNMDVVTLNDSTFLIFANQSGFHAGIINYDNLTKTVTFNPTKDFFFGEVVTAILTTNIRTLSGTNLSPSFVWSFTIGVSGGSGLFQSDTDYSTISGVQSIYGGDLDGDGDIDLANAIVANSNNITILLNNGSGIFEERQTLTVGDEPRSITGGDFDKDYDIDLVTANSASNNIVILINRGNGIFEFGSTYNFNENPFFVVINDFNGDGNMDLATANRETNSVSILLNNNNCTFVIDSTYRVGQAPRSLTSGDFDRDGSIDLATADLGSNQLSILMNNGDGIFRIEKVYRAGSASSNPHFISAKDINGDYYLDLIVTNRGIDSILVLQNRGDGSFTPYSSYKVGSEPRALYLGDLDHDIDLDLVTANYGSNDIFVYLNKGEGKFFKDSTYVTGNAPRFVLGGDVDKDGDIDLAIANFFANNVSIFKNINSIQRNYPPESPLLNEPQHNSYISNSKPNLTWQIPADGDGDSLHFCVEIHNDNTLIFDSLLDTSGFNPSPPLAQGVGLASYSLQDSLSDDELYKWRVIARDQNTYGEPSTEWQFIVDTTPPTIDSIAISKPHFISNWFNQNMISIIELMIYYNEIHAARAVLNPGILNNLVVNDSIKSGLDQMVKFSIDVAGAPDAGYWIVANVLDSASNAVQDSVLIQLDSTPPASVTATSIEDTCLLTSFMINWNKANDTGSGVSGYDVCVKVDDGEWQDWLVDSLCTSAIYDGEHRHLYSFETRARDNVDNIEPFTGIAEVQVYVDTTRLDLAAPSAPLNLSAGSMNPSQWQNDPVFSINWTNPPDPSGIKRSLYKLGTAPTSQYDTIGTALGIPPIEVEATQEDGQPLYLWLEDGRGNVDYQNWADITLRYDATSPVIDSLVALAPDFPPNWYNQDSTLVLRIRMFYNEAHAASTSLTTGGLGDPDELHNIPIGADQTVEFNVNIADAPDGSYRLRATLHDSAGNQEIFSSLIIKLDSTPPFISHIPLFLVDEGQGVIINAMLKDNNRIAKAMLYYRKGGQSTYNAIQLTSQDDTTFQAIIPGADVGSRGIDYFLMATDGLNNSHSPYSNWLIFPHHIQVRIIGENNQGLINNSPQPSGSAQKAFRMISLPIIIDDPKPHAVLEDDLDSYDKKKWRFFQYNPKSGTYDEFPDIDDLSPGKAFWLIVKDPNKIIDSGVGTSVPSDSSFVIPLQRGWNDIGNPFNFEIDWDNISVSSGNIYDVMGPYTYEDRWLLPSEIMKIVPWKGYTIYTDQHDLSLIIPPNESLHGMNRSLCNPFSDVQWQLILEATCQQALDVANIIGCAEEASKEWDKRDYLEPPPIGSYVSLSFPHDDWDRFQGCYTTDFRSKFSRGEIWNFKIETNIEDSEVKLKIKNIQGLISRFEVLLFDISGYQKINLKETTSYSFKSNRREDIRYFKLVIGIPEFVSEVESEIPMGPGKFHLTQNYPNPFNLETQIQYQLPHRIFVTIKIFNLLGQKIKTLVSEEQERGYYKILWNGNDNYNQVVRTGIYILRMKAGNFVHIKKMILIK